jgi:hypothetical protein
VSVDNIVKFRELLGKTAEKLTDEQVLNVMDIQYKLADIIFDIYLEENNKENDTKQ